ncbi:MAG: TRAP transporter small permease [Syntrophales bacterium]|jgi:TRAP-type C4-dicarboxylate transport system permease small subunit|nr:TRAP transporter small permease [Syntrophales bacterium]
MKKLIIAIDRISGFGGWTAGIMTVIALLIVCSEIVTRSIFGKTLYISDEYSGYLMAMLTFFGLAYTLRERGHIRMMFLFHFLKGRRKVIYNMGCSVVGFLFSVSLVWFTFEFFWDSVINKTQSMQITESYLAIPQAFLPIGSFFMMLQFVSEFLKGAAVLRQDAEGLRILEETDELGR